MEREHKRSRQVLLGFIAAIAATALCCSGLLYRFFVSYCVASAREKLSQQLRNAQQITDDLLSSVNKKLFFLAENTDVLQLLNSDSLTPLELYYCLYNLRSFQQENDDLYRSIYYYNASSDQIYVGMSAYPAADFYDQDMVERLKSGACRNLSPIPRTARNGLTPVSTEDYYTFVYSNASRDRLKSAIVINMSAEYVRSVAMSVYDETVDLLILDPQGQVVLGSENYPFCSVLDDSRGLGAFLGSGGDGFYTAESGRSLVSRVESTVCGWRYTGIIAYSAIQKEIVEIISRALLLLAAFAVLAILVGVFGARRLDRAHRRRMREVRESYEWQQKNDDVRLQKALDNAILRSGPEDWAKAAALGVAPDFSAAFRMAVFAAEPARSPGDRELFFYGVRNILQELFTCRESRAFVCEHGENILVLLNGPEEALGEEWLREQLSLAQETAFDYSGIPFAAVYSELLYTADEIGASCEECLDNGKYRIFLGPRMLTSCRELRALQSNKYQLPAEQLRMLANCILAGDRDAARKLVDDLADATRGHAFSAVKLLVMRIAATVQELHQDDPLWYEEEQMNCWLELLRRLPQLGSLDQVKQEIAALLDIDILSRPVREKFGEERRFSRILTQMDRLIAENYADPNFNPDLAADRLQISPAYCKKIFRANMGLSLSDYITRYRLEKAAELLRTTQVPVVAIAEACGFANINYFYTIFKKNYGVTAGTYRQTHR